MKAPKTRSPTARRCERLSELICRERPQPDATTVLQFRHLLKPQGLTKKLLEAVNAGLSAAGRMMREGTIADATIIAAPPSVKNEAKARDPDMHQTKKGNQ